MGFHKPECYIGGSADRCEAIDSHGIFGLIRNLDTLHQQFAKPRQAFRKLFDVFFDGLWWRPEALADPDAVSFRIFSRLPEPFGLRTRLPYPAVCILVL